MKVQGVSSESYMTPSNLRVQAWPGVKGSSGSRTMRPASAVIGDHVNGHGLPSRVTFRQKGGWRLRSTAMGGSKAPHCGRLEVSSATGAKHHFKLSNVLGWQRDLYGSDILVDRNPIPVVLLHYLMSRVGQLKVPGNRRIGLGLGLGQQLLTLLVTNPGQQNNNKEKWE